MMKFHTDDFKLDSGQIIENLEISYECYGQLNHNKDNVILVAHGITSSHHAVGAPTPDRRRGWYNEIIGSKKLLDTDRYCIISSNCLGSSYGSTGPASRNPSTGEPYGRDFPEITYRDVVRAQYLLLQAIGVHHLVAIVASSVGGFQAFQWAVTYPDFMSAIIALDTAPKDTFDTASSLNGLLERFSSDPNWNDGDYYSKGSMAESLTRLRVETLRSFGFEDKLAEDLDAAERERILWETAREWAMEFDAHSLLTLMRAWSTFNVEGEFNRIAAPMLYVLCDTDEWFPARIGRDVLEKLHSAGVKADYCEVNSPLGHYATTEEPEKWVPTAREFLNRVVVSKGS
ncbi:alpha/beta fold hydrolase [Aliiroseovarius sp. KMU-50]|uniref:Alpha/beta fold hydrolase n=1 Tax=Aliiroseovarius salicola TaxID=3009082 RepID=A0ABT4W0B4_9RHOB|nr:alpha/beta fold hydrolase [Aliiroseovarius sp. KMU-50]MDA5093935.1 alpha/beta fold hydrolase [Aliiroseovarius sp. KMU-50]